MCEAPVPLNETGPFAKCCCVDLNAGGIFTTLAPFNGGERKEKEPDNLKDVLSTGRHRAAQAKPIVDGTICEWANLKNAGGGVKPIVGCKGNMLVKKRGGYARHHGPDKSVLNNTEENLHLICPTCHNRWHALNDEYYGDGTGDSRPPAGQTWVPRLEYSLHDPNTPATPSDIFMNEMFWATNPISREVLANVRESGEVSE